jgi:RES domain-containing protein
MRCWRICSAKRASSAFTGIGASLSPGRWNSLGVRMVYTAEHRATAMLEILVHANAAELQGSYVLIGADIPDDAIAPDLGQPLPTDWRTIPAPPSCSAIGDAWIQANTALAAWVPSLAAHGERNLIINPLHPRMPAVIIQPAEALIFDPRFKASGPVSISTTTIVRTRRPKKP